MAKAKMAAAALQRRWKRQTKNSSHNPRTKTECPRWPMNFGFSGDVHLEVPKWTGCAPKKN